jgi:hypothetical protein
MKIMKNYIVLFVMIGTLSFQSCKKFVEIDLPVDRQSAESVYRNLESASLVMTGVFQTLGQDRFFGLAGANGISIGFGLRSDDLSTLTYYQDMYLGLPYAHVGNNYWNNIYGKHLFTVNSIIEGVSKSDELTQAAKGKLLGEAKFTRAFLFFYLVNIYGDVPLVLTTDFKLNSNIPRKSKQLIYDQIVEDLLEAQVLLGEQYLAANLSVDPKQERLRPNKAAATALLARVYLYTGQWQKAEDEATKVISNSGVYGLVALNDVFLKNSKEAIWQLQPNPSDETNINTLEGNTIIPEGDDFPKVFLSWYTLATFDENDLRKSAWTKTVDAGTSDEYNIPFKYKVRQSLDQTEYVMVLRLAEQYLIRAEARIHNNKITDGITDLNVLRARASDLNQANLTPIIGNFSQLTALEYVAKERQSELFSEWGHRWFDLKRTGKIDEVMGLRMPSKLIGGQPASWSLFMTLLPIPPEEFKYNSALKGHQNPGYPENAP